MDKRLNLVWLDLEMTGLKPESDRIIEIATLVTDAELNILGEGPVLAIKQSDAALDEEEATRQTIEFLSQFSEKNASPMCGNSICQDRRFMANYMPELENYFHYRNLDVSSVKELVRRWKPEILKGLVKQGAHQAMEDIKDSVAELKYYREHFIDA